MRGQVAWGCATLTFVIVAAQIGLPARLLSPTTSSSLLAAGLLSAAIFQGTALRLLHSHGPAPAPPKIYGPRRDGKHLYGSGGLP
jgi:hypothetical protein